MEIFYSNISWLTLYVFKTVILIQLDIHCKRILHRDLKSLNLFLDAQDNIKIGDFGVSKILNHTRSMANTQVGTPYYLSPELCENRPYAGTYKRNKLICCTEKSDIWALGCVLYEMCMLRHPFDANNQGALIMKIIKGQYPPLSKYYSQDLEKIVKYCLQKNEKMRLFTEQLLGLPCIQQQVY